MENENKENNNEKKVETPKKSNKTVLIVIGVIVGLFVLGGIGTSVVGWLAFNKLTKTGNNIITDAINQAQEEADKNTTDDDDDYDMYAQDDVDQIDEYGGRIYATKHGMPDDFPKSVTIVKPSQLKQITSRAEAKGEAPVMWHVITESGFATVEETKAAIEKAYDGFGEKFDMMEMPGAEQFKADSVIQRYNNDKYTVGITATQQTEYKKGPVGNFMIVYDVEVK